MRARPILLPLLIVLASASSAPAQDKGSVDAKPLPPLDNPKDPKIGAKQFFARKLLPSSQTPKVIGSYTNGCLAGGEQMPITGDTWQVMRLSRNRYWGYPDTIALIKRLSEKAHKDAGWPGILVGDIGQPRGGPALSGHASHQIGLDADIWLTPMPDHLLSRQEREEMSATMMVRDDRLDIDPKAWTPTHWMVIRDAAQEPAVQRIFVNAAIKKALCREAKGDRELALQGAAVVGPRLSLPHPHALPGRRQGVQGTVGPGRRRRLQARGDGLLVQGFDHPSQARAAEAAAEADRRDQAVGDAGGLQGGAERAGFQAIRQAIT